MSSPHDNSIYTNENSVFFALTRMNPPMPGHLGIVEILINKAIEKGINQVYVCLSKVLDKGNPISCELKKSVLGDEKQACDRITMINSLKRKMIETLLQSITVSQICLCYLIVIFFIILVMAASFLFWS